MPLLGSGNDQTVGVLIDSKANTKGFDTTDRKLDKLSGSFGRTSAKSIAFGNIMANAASAGFDIVKSAITDTISVASKFESQMSNISTLISGDSTEAISKMKNGILDLTGVIPKSADDLGAAAYDIVSAGISDTGDALKVLESSGKLATAGLSTTAEATNIMTSALNAFGYDAAESDKVANVLFKTVKNGKTTVSQMTSSFGAAAPVLAAANVSLEEFSAATAALTTSGLPASQAQNSLRASVVQLVKPTKEMKELLTELGIESGDAAIKQHGLVKVMDMVKEAAKGDSEMLAKAWSSVEALGAATALTGKQADSFAASLDDMGSSSDSLTEGFEKQKETFENSWAILKNKFTAGAIKLGSKVLPVLARAMEKLTDDVLPALSRWWDENKESISAVAKSVVDFLKPVLVDLWKIFKEDLIPAWKNLFEAIKPILPIIGVALVVVLRLALERLKNLAQIGVIIIDVFAAFIKANNWVIEAIINLAKTVWHDVEPAFRWIGEKIRWLRDKFNGLSPSIKTALSGLAATISLPFQPILTAIGWVQTLIEKFRILRDEQPKKSPGGLNVLTHGSGLTTLTNGRQHARGGRPFKGVANLVGEEGPELFIPRQAGTIVPAGQTRSMLNGSGGSVNNTRTVTIQNVMLGSADAAREFFAQLDNDTLLSSNGMTPIRGAV